MSGAEAIKTGGEQKREAEGGTAQDYHERLVWNVVRPRTPEYIRHRVLGITQPITLAMTQSIAADILASAPLQRWGSPHGFCGKAFWRCANRNVASIHVQERENQLTSANPGCIVGSQSRHQTKEVSSNMARAK